VENGRLLNNNLPTAFLPVSSQFKKRNNEADYLNKKGRIQHSKNLHEESGLKYLTDCEIKQRLATFRKPDCGVEFGVISALSSTLQLISSRRVRPTASVPAAASIPAVMAPAAFIPATAPTPPPSSGSSTPVLIILPVAIPPAAPTPQTAASGSSTTATPSVSSAGTKRTSSSTSHAPPAKRANTSSIDNY